MNWFVFLIFGVPVLASCLLGGIIYSLEKPSYVAQFYIVLQGEKRGVGQLVLGESHRPLKSAGEQLTAITPVFQRHTYSPVDFEINPGKIEAFVGERLISPSFFSNYVQLNQSANETFEVTVAALGGTPAHWRVNMITTDPEKTQAGITRAIDVLIKELSKSTEEQYSIFLSGKISQIEKLIERAKADIEFDKEQQISALHQNIEAIREQIRALEASRSEIIALTSTDQKISSDLKSIIDALHRNEKLKLESKVLYLSNRTIAPSSRSLLALKRLEQMKSAYETTILAPLNVRQFFPDPNQPILMLSQSPINWQQRDLFGLFVLVSLAVGISLGFGLNWLRLNWHLFHKKKYLG